MRKNDYYVYMLLCSDGSYYTGVTNDYERRFAEHRDGIVSGCYTFKRRPLKLVYVSHFHDVLEAIAWEKKVKRWRREKKEALIKREWEKLITLSHTAKNYTVYMLNKAIHQRVMVSLSNHGTRAFCNK